jgi:hypothetical protein
VRPGGAIWGLWKILDEKGESGLFSCLELRGGSLRLSQLIMDRSSGPVEKVRLCTDTYGIYRVPQN